MTRQETQLGGAVRGAVYTFGKTMRLAMEASAENKSKESVKMGAAAVRAEQYITGLAPGVEQFVDRVEGAVQTGINAAADMAVTAIDGVTDAIVTGLGLEQTALPEKPEWLDSGNDIDSLREIIADGRVRLSDIQIACFVMDQDHSTDDQPQIAPDIGIAQWLVGVQRFGNQEVMSAVEPRVDSDMETDFVFDANAFLSIEEDLSENPLVKHNPKGFKQWVDFATRVKEASEYLDATQEQDS